MAAACAALLEDTIKAAPASVLAEVTRQLLGRCSPAQLSDVLVFEDRLAIEGILKPFELGLEMLDPRPSVSNRCSQPGSGFDPRPSPRARHSRLKLACTLRTSQPSGEMSRERKRERDPDGRIRGQPRGSRSFSPSSAPRHGRASAAPGPGAEVPPAGPARPLTLLPFRVRHNPLPGQAFPWFGVKTRSAQAVSGRCRPP